MKSVYIYSSKSSSSIDTEKLLRKKLDNVGIAVKEKFSEDISLLVCIGGDGTFLEAIHKFNFPKMAIIGINTGHLGFFQEIMPQKLDDFIFNFSQDKYSIQQLSTVKAIVKSDGTTYEHTALNEIVIGSFGTKSVHLNISIGGSFIERFSGDGLLISSPAGSTAYNYSMGGSIVDPRLKLLQVTPMAPMNTTAYRSFTSSILLPSDLSLDIVPDISREHAPIQIAYDGSNQVYNKVDSIEVYISNTTVNLMRFDTYDFWRKVKNKFL